MKKYTPEEKAQALDMMEKLGTKHTSQTLKITDTTLYRWRREAELAALIPPQMEDAEHVQEQNPAEEAEKPTNGMHLLEAVEEAKPVQHTDGLLQQALETIRCLDEENSRLIEMIQQLRTALRTLAGVI